MQLLDRMMKTECTEEGHHTSVDHLCAGKIVRVKVPVGLFVKVRLPYCEFHARWVQGKA